MSHPGILRSILRVGLMSACLLLLYGCRQSSIELPAGQTSPSMSPIPTPSSGPIVPGGTFTGTLRVNWTANREKAVNMAGGGYRVYYSTSANFNIATASFVNVPYVAGASAPTTAAITGLSANTRYYIKVVAYSALNPPGGATGSTSSPSAEFTVQIP